MQLAVILRILGILLSLFSLTMIPPLIISLVTNDGSITPFLLAFVIILLTNFKRKLEFFSPFLFVVHENKNVSRKQIKKNQSIFLNINVMWLPVSVF